MGALQISDFGCSVTGHSIKHGVRACHLEQFFKTQTRFPAFGHSEWINYYAKSVFFLIKMLTDLFA